MFWLTLALTFWFLHYMYYTRVRKRFKVLLFQDRKFLHEYRTNIRPRAGETIYLTVNGIKKAYHIKFLVLRVDENEEINLSVIDLKIDFNELHTKNPIGTTVPEQENNSPDSTTRPQGQVDPKQDR